MPRTIHALPVHDAAPFALLPLWRAEAESATTRAFAETIAELG